MDIIYLYYMRVGKMLDDMTASFDLTFLTSRK